MSAVTVPYLVFAVFTGAVVGLVYYLVQFALGTAVRLLAVLSLWALHGIRHLIGERL